MSDTSILPDATTAPPGPSAPDFGDEPTDDRRRLMIVGGGIAAVIVLVLAYMLLKGGGGSAADTQGAVPRGTPHVATSPVTAPSDKPAGTSKAGAPKAGTTLPKKSNRRLAKDPFKPGVGLVTDTGATGSTTTVDGGGTAPAPGTVPTTPTEGGAPNAALGPPLAIHLVDVIGSSVAVFDVTYSHHQVFRFQVQAPAPGSAQGTVFAQDFALLGLQNKEATLQVGDDTPFDMRKGTSHQV